MATLQRNAPRPRRRQSPATMETPVDEMDSPQMPPGEDPQQPINPGPGEIEVPPQMAAFDHLKQIPSARWNELSVYVYRLEPRVRNSGPSKYIEIFSCPFDEADIQAKHGGGKYQAILKNATTNMAERKWNFDVGGAPKLLSGQSVIDEAGNVLTTVSSTPAAAPMPAAFSENAIAQVVSQLVPLFKQNVTPDQAVEAMRKGFDASLSIVTETAKANAHANVPKNSREELKDLLEIVALINKPAQPQRSRTEELKELLELMQLMNGGRQQPQRSLINELKALKDDLGVDPALLFGAGGDSGPDFKQLLAQAALKAADNIPAVLQMLTMSRMPTAPATRGIPMAPPQLAGVPPASTPQGAPIGIVIPPATPDAQTPASEVKVDPINAVMSVVRNAFLHEMDGADALRTLDVAFPEMTPVLEQFLGGQPIAAVDAWCRTNPVLSPITTDPRWPVFLQEFIKELVEPDDDEAEAAEAN